MGFLKGSTTFERYWITKDETPELGSDHIEKLEEENIGKHTSDSIDDTHVGFLGGNHVLDVQFDLEKNLLPGALHFAVRIDTTRIPAAMRQAWTQMELLPLMEDNPFGRPTKAQREQAKEAVEARCEAEAKTGKYRRMQSVPVVWDADEAVLYLGSTSRNANDLCLQLLERVFDLEFDRVTSGKLCRAFAEREKRVAELHQTSPSPFVEELSSGNIVWWNGMGENYDYLGNEFLLWLWWHFETKSDTVRLADDSEVAGMFARNLALACPLGEQGKETFSSESPIALPEAIQGIRSGKLPRKAGLSLIRHDRQFDFTLQAEEFAIGSAKTQLLGDDEPSDSPRADRIENLRLLSETIDLLFEAFCRRRLGKTWNSELRGIQEWLKSAATMQRRQPAA